MNELPRNSVSRRDLLRLGAAIPLTAGMLQASEPEISVPSFNTLTDQEEIAFGRKVAAEMDAQLPLLRNPLLDDYVNKMVSKLGHVSKRPNMDYLGKVINTSTVNAYSILGGHLYVYRGLLHFIDTEAELACVLGHEVGHVVGHHSANNIMMQVRARQLYETVKNNVLLQNDIIRQVIQKLGGPLAVLALLHYQRSEEFQADLFGFYEVLRAGWNPDGFIAFFERLRKATGDPDLVHRLESTHPPSGERAERIRHEMTVVQMPSHMTENSMEFRLMKAALNALPPPPKQPEK